MKRKFKDAIELFAQVHKKGINKFLKEYFYLYRAYGYFSSSEYAKALADYNESEKYQKSSD